VIVIGAITGVCFAVLAGLSISAMAEPVRSFHVFSIVIAGVATSLGYMAFRATMAGNDESPITSFRRGVIGGLVGLIVIVAFLFMFRPDTQGILAHALGKPASSFTIFRLLIASVLLGFGAGFVVRL